MSRPLTTPKSTMLPTQLPPAKPRHLMSDAQRMARGRAQFAAGEYIEVEDLDVYLDGLSVFPPQV
ncbi:hypothetical protein [Caulobacter sp. UNC279MFTsu5.1]|uniref:hypothetical protein n=1 Tax=Caulobacter sp. UNC279MFTsu5.1 TaxID=1502775 RepID=UPI0008F29CCE|nr:hypothetical protein [Caulobacter sp. UNC279MFTsu5.1]SFJ30652.1 hypothetical protein SAMN02799626_01503 [Caulobacter sp. UNC279MFTsu5.1]